MKRVYKIHDHKVSYPSIAYLDPKISERTVCDCQNDIYVIKDKTDLCETGEIIAVIMGQRLKTTSSNLTHSNTISTNSVVYVKIEHFASSITNLPTLSGYIDLLMEFLADKNCYLIRYEPTGNENKDMLEALTLVGFKLIHKSYYRLPGVKCKHRF